MEHYGVLLYDTSRWDTSRKKEIYIKFAELVDLSIQIGSLEYFQHPTSSFKLHGQLCRELSPASTLGFATGIIFWTLFDPA